jgi:hypothetical protein
MTSSLMIVALTFTVGTANGALLLLRRRIGKGILTSPIRNLLYIILHGAKHTGMLGVPLAVSLSSLFYSSLGGLKGGLEIRS